IEQLEQFVSAVLDIPNIRDIRLASKGLMGIPQHFLQDKVLQALDRLAHKAFERGVSLALHTHVNHANQVTPLLGRAAKKLREKGISYWTKNYRTGIEMNDPDALERRYEYYDPIYLLPESGQRWWREQARAA